MDGLREIVLESDREGVAAEARCDRFFSFSFSRCCSSSLLLSSAVVVCLSLLRDVHREVFTTGWSVLNTPDRRRSCLELILYNACYYGAAIKWSWHACCYAASGRRGIDVGMFKVERNVKGSARATAPTRQHRTQRH